MIMSPGLAASTAAWIVWWSSGTEMVVPEAPSSPSDWSVSEAESVSSESPPQAEANSAKAKSTPSKRVSVCGLVIVPPKGSVLLSDWVQPSTTSVAESASTTTTVPRIEPAVAVACSEQK